METEVSQFHRDIARQIVDHCEKEMLKIGDRITERSLATTLGVSRSPVRAALAYMAQEGAIEYRPNSGYLLNYDGDSLRGVLASDTPSDFDQLYEKILTDRFNNKIPKHLSERDCMRRYDITRGQLMKVFLRLSNEGLIYRSQGHGWSFTEMLVTPEAYVASYELRMAIEPTALLLPGFTLDRDKLEHCYAKHMKILDEGLGSVTSSELFELDAELHELLMQLSGNPYFLQAIQHQNSLRRVVEYQSYYMDERIEDSCKEHVEILDALRRGQSDIASTLLKRHLQLASEAQKTFETQP